jgi:hypothetical protein
MDVTDPPELSDELNPGRSPSLPFKYVESIAKLNEALAILQASEEGEPIGYSCSMTLPRGRSRREVRQPPSGLRKLEAVAGKPVQHVLARRYQGVGQRDGAPLHEDRDRR